MRRSAGATRPPPPTSTGGSAQDYAGRRLGNPELRDQLLDPACRFLGLSDLGDRAARSDGGMRVLEIGAGTGYNAALVCERLSSDWVSSVDIHPRAVELARARLGANGYTPTLAALDGAGGYPLGAV